MSKIMQFVVKGIVAAGALVAALMLIAPFAVVETTLPVVGKVSEGMNLFDAWDLGLDGAKADYIIMIICYSVVFFLGLIMAVLAVLAMFVDNKVLNKALKIVGVALAVLVIVGLVCNFVYVDGIGTSMAKIGAAGIVSAIFGLIAVSTVYAEKALK